MSSMQSSKGQGDAPLRRTRQANERARQALAMRRAGLSGGVIGHSLGVTAWRASQLIRNGERDELFGRIAEFHDYLSAMTANSLCAAGLFTREAVALRFRKRPAPGEIVGLGKIGIAEVVRWLTRTSGHASLSTVIEVDDENDIVTVCGVKYAGELFRGLAGALPVGSLFRLENRHDGVVTVMKVPSG